MSKQKQKGSLFEVQVLNHLTDNGLMAFRNPPSGSKDKGDITVFTRFGKVVIECKNHRRMELAEWLEEAETEKGNADAVFGFVAHKRRGFGDAKIGGTYVAMTLDDWIEMVR